MTKGEIHLQSISFLSPISGPADTPQHWQMQSWSSAECLSVRAGYAQHWMLPPYCIYQTITPYHSINSKLPRRRISLVRKLFLHIVLSWQLGSNSESLEANWDVFHSQTNQDRQPTLLWLLFYCSTCLCPQRQTTFKYPEKGKLIRIINLIFEPSKSQQLT